MLTDAPGLGKTLQASEAAVAPVLVACPTYLLNQWEEFLTQQYPHQTVAVARGSTDKRYEAIVKFADWTIINIEMLRSYEFGFVRTLIIDESHHIRNKDSQQARGALELARSRGVERVYLLTGTPIKKEPDDLFMQLRVIDPLRFTSYHSFIRNYCVVIGTPWGDKVVGIRDTERFKHMLSYYALGRTYDDVRLQLPDLISTNVYVTLESTNRHIYDKMESSLRLEDITFENALSLMHALRLVLLTSSEKLEATSDLIDDLGVSDYVIYTWYKDSAYILSELLKCPYITGDTPNDKRIQIAHSSKAIVATMSSMSEGVDLSDKKVLIFHEVDYVPGTMYQALSRVRRHSVNNDPVRAYYILTRNTVEESIAHVMFERAQTAYSILRSRLV